MTRGSRGQALIETAIALPLFLVAMFGVIWALQTGVLGERVQLLARYGGMVSAEINPYQQYSLYAAYNAAAGSPLSASCATPPPTLIADGAPLASPATGTLPFWQPSSGSTTASTTCAHTVAAGAGMSSPMLLGSAQVSVSTASDAPTALQGLLGAHQQRSATLTGFASPDMSSLIGCFTELHAAFEHSTMPQTDPVRAVAAVADHIVRHGCARDDGELQLAVRFPAACYARRVAITWRSDGGRPYSSKPTR